MYTVLKTKRLKFQIPLNKGESDQEELQAQQFRQMKDLNDMIVGSCFMDDSLVLFLFNSGRYLVVDTAGGQSKGKTSSTNGLAPSTQIIYHGNIVHQISEEKYKNQEQRFKESHTNPPKRLMPRNSLNLIEQSYSKVIFTQCKRIQLNQCILITKHSANVYWLKLIRQSQDKEFKDYGRRVRVQIRELPGSMLGDMLKLDSTYMTLNLTILTELCEFNNSEDDQSLSSNKQGLRQGSNSLTNKGSFYIKNEIVQDKMIYFTVYTRIPQKVIKKYTNHQNSQQELHIDQCHVPTFIITKYEFPVPINDVSGSFVIEVSDKYSNEIAIYRQFGDDGNDWQIRLISFGFDEIQGEEVFRDYVKGLLKQNQRIQKGFNTLLTISNTMHLPKTKTFALPEEFTSSINIQQIIRVDQTQQKSHQTSYLIVSINQTYTQDPQQPQEQGLHHQHQQNQQIYEQQSQQQQEAHGINLNVSYCWTHICRLKQQQNSGKYTQWIEKCPKYKFEATSFLKIININYHQGLLYILRYAHQRVNNQLYENKLDLVSIDSGTIVQKGYCSLKNYSFSPNQLSILDTPQVFSTQEDFFFHLRMLFDKKSIYAFMIQNSEKYFAQVTDSGMVQTILSLL